MEFFCSGELTFITNDYLWATSAQTHNFTYTVPSDINNIVIANANRTTKAPTITTDKGTVNTVNSSNYTNSASENASLHLYTVNDCAGATITMSIQLSAYKWSAFDIFSLQ